MAITPVKNLTTQDILYGDRTTEYRWEVLEHSNGVDYLVGTLDGVSEGSLAWVQNAAVKGRGKMEVIDLPAAAPGMLRIGELSLETCRIRPVMTLNGADQTGSYRDVWVETERNIALNPLGDPSGPAFSANAGALHTVIKETIPSTSNPQGILSRVKSAIKAGAVSNSVMSLYNVDGLANTGPPRYIGGWFYVNASGYQARIGGTAEPYVDLPVGTWKWIASTIPIAANAYSGAYITKKTGMGNAAESDIGYLTGVTAYTDTIPTEAIWGSRAPLAPYRRYAWTGVAHASASTLEIRTQEWVSSGESVIPEIPWGTFLLEKATEDWEDTGRVWKLSLLDRTTVPSQDVVDQSYAVAAGTNILKEVRAILATSGEYMAIDESVDLATRSGMVWEAGTSKLNIINDLLDSAGYNSLWMDGWGNFQATPRVLPADRSIIYELLGFPRELADGEKSIYSPEWTRERDSFRVPNKVIAVQAAGGEDEEALVGQWTNEDPASPYSYISRGRWIPHVLDSVDCPEGTEAEILAFLEARARATLIQMSAVQAEVKVEHLPIPVRVGDVLRFANTRAGIDTRHTITRLDLDTSPTGLMKSTLQEVISL